MRRFLPLVALLACLAGCGGDDGGGAPGRGTLALDFQPNPVHAGIYAAENIRIRVPSASTDSLKLLAAGRADMSVVDIHDLGLARERGSDIVGVGALVQRPLAAVITRGSEVRRPRDLEGRRVGVTGLPSDDAVLRAVVEHDGGRFERVRRVTIGFSAVPSLITGRVDAVVSFWNAEGVALRERGVDTREFRVDDYGAPRYPELVLAVTRETLDERGELVDSMLAELERARAPRCATARRRSRSWCARRGPTSRSCARSSRPWRPRCGRRCGSTARRSRAGPSSTRASGSCAARPTWSARSGCRGRLGPRRRRATGAARRQQRLHERGRLARHARARHHPLEAGLLRAPAHVLLHVRVEAEPRQARLGGLLDARVGLVGQVDHEQLGVVGGGHRLMPGRSQRSLELRAEQQVGAEQRDPWATTARGGG